MAYDKRLIDLISLSKSNELNLSQKIDILINHIINLENELDKKKIDPAEGFEIERSAVSAYIPIENSTIIHSTQKKHSTPRKSRLFRMGSRNGSAIT